MPCSVLVFQHTTALWEGLFPTAELCCVCQLRLLPVPHSSPPCPTHRGLDKRRWRANVSQTAPEHLRKVCAGAMAGRDTGHWAAVATGMFNNQQRGLTELQFLCEQWCLLKVCTESRGFQSCRAYVAITFQKSPLWTKKLKDWCCQKPFKALEEGYMHGKNTASLFLILWTLFNCCICISEINLSNLNHYKVLIFLEQGIEWHLRKRVIILEEKISFWNRVIFKLGLAVPMGCYTAIPEPLLTLLQRCLPLPLSSCLLTGFKCLNCALSNFLSNFTRKWREKWQKMFKCFKQIIGWAYLLRVFLMSYMSGKDCSYPPGSDLA